jgi:hypothetical protein
LRQGDPLLLFMQPSSKPSGARWLTITLASFSLILLAYGASMRGVSAQAETGTAIPESPDVPVMPTVDRLAAPPTVASPTQADDGAQLYWLWCQPCHGDQGQGLTDEWREQYPPEDRNCWDSGCHGEVPYEDGFTLPEHVPPVIGEGALPGYQTAEQLYTYIHARMPFEYPGVLEDEEYLAVTAFLLRENGRGDGATLSMENLAAAGRPQGVAPTGSPDEPARPPAPTIGAIPTPLGERGHAADAAGGPEVFWLGAAAVLLGAGTVIGAWIWRHRH